MKFFKKKSNKQNIDNKHHSPTTKNHEKDSSTETRKTCSDSLLQLNLLDDFSSSINIPQLFFKGNIETITDNSSIRGSEASVSTIKQKSTVFTGIFNGSTTPQLPDYITGECDREKESVELEKYSQSNHYAPQKNDVLISDIITSDEWYNSNDLLHTKSSSNVYCSFFCF